MDLQPERTRCLLHVCSSRPRLPEFRVDKKPTRRGFGHQFAQQLELLARQARVEEVTPVTLPPGRLRLATRPSFDRIAAGREHDRNRRGRGLGRKRRADRTGCDDHGHLAAHQLGRQRRQPIVLTFRPAEFDRDVLALDVAGFLSGPRGTRPRTRRVRRATPLSRNPITGIAGCCARAASGQRRRAAEQRDELAPPHSITSSARASSVGGTSRPSALAVLRLITSSNLVDCRPEGRRAWRP